MARYGVLYVLEMTMHLYSDLIAHLDLAGEVVEAIEG